MRNDFTPAELVARLAAERRSSPFLIFKDGHGAQRILELETGPLTVGRLPENNLTIDWDPEVSRVHAVLEQVAGIWAVTDDKLSRNGSFVNEQRVAGRCRLADGDVLRFGSTLMTFRAPGPTSTATATANDVSQAAHVTDAQRRVLVALCRPFASGMICAPASNSEIATELFLSVDGVRTHLRALFEAFEIPDLPQNRKRTELARRALALGLVGDRDFVH